MAFSAAVVPPLLPAVGRAQALAILAAMRAVAAPDGTPSGMAQRAVGAAARYVFGDEALAMAAGGRIRRDQLAAAVRDPGLAELAGLWRAETVFEAQLPVELADALHAVWRRAVEKSMGWAEPEPR